MAKKTTAGPAVLTANRLLTGDTVFWSGCDWVASIHEAARAADACARTALAETGKAEEAANRVVGTYLVALDPVTGEPTTLRETRRLAGPSVAIPVNAPRAG